VPCTNEEYVNAREHAIKKNIRNQELKNIKNNRMKLLSPFNSNVTLKRPNSINHLKSIEAESEISFDTPIESKYDRKYLTSGFINSKKDSEVMSYHEKKQEEYLDKF
jgi:hypothetical protein